MLLLCTTFTMALGTGGCFFLFPDRTIAPDFRPALPRARHTGKHIVLGTALDERAREGPGLGAVVYPSQGGGFKYTQRLSFDGKTVAHWTTETLRAELESAGFDVLDPASGEQNAPRLDAKVRVFGFRSTAGDDGPPAFATTIALHIEVRVNGALVLKKNYLSETHSVGEYGFLWVTSASLAHAIAAGTADMTKQVVPDVLDVLECGSLHCNRKTPASRQDLSR